MAKPGTPMSATTDKLIRKMSHDNINCRDGTAVMVEPETIHIYSGTVALHLPRAVFDEIAMWYTEGLIPKGDTRGKSDN